MAFEAEYYNAMARDYRARRDLLVPVLREAGFQFTVPEGAYYILADYSALSGDDDVTFARWLASEVGVAGVPGSSFYHDRSAERRLIRFAFCKRAETLQAAAERFSGMLSGLRD
jgi:aminotransferase